MLGIMANSGVFGSVTAKGATEDNGITFSNIKIEDIHIPKTSLEDVFLDLTGRKIND